MKNKYRLNDYKLIIDSNMFDERWFSREYKLRKSDDAILYYLRYGRKLGLNPSPDFDNKWYADTYDDVKRSGVDPFIHYISFGKKEGRYPNQKACDLVNYEN